MAKKLVPIMVGVQKKAKASASVRDGNLTDADCCCATMAPHCPIHSTVKPIPAPGNDVIR